MLQELSMPQLETALNFLHHQQPMSPPQGLPELNELEWFLLGKMLDQLLLEKDSSPLQ